MKITLFQDNSVKSIKMADREDNVYMAKLAEQAERYDGKCYAKSYGFIGLTRCCDGETF